MNAYHVNHHAGSVFDVGTKIRSIRETCRIGIDPVPQPGSAVTRPHILESALLIPLFIIITIPFPDLQIAVYRLVGSAPERQVFLVRDDFGVLVQLRAHGV